MFASLLASGSYVAIVAVLLLTGLGLPLPEEVAVIAAGMAAAAGQLDPWLAAGCCIVGILLGDGVLYLAGRRFGRNLPRGRAWWTRMVTPERELKMERLILRHGLKVLFFGRFLIGLRVPIYLTAGVLHMPPRRFLLIDTISTVVVAGSFFLLSFVYGSAVGHWIRRAEILTTLALVATVAIALALLHLRSRSSAASEATLPGPDATQPRRSEAA